MVDCLIVGHNDGKFAADVEMVEGMGRSSGAYRDLLLSFLMLEGQPARALDVLNALGVADSRGDRAAITTLSSAGPRSPISDRTCTAEDSRSSTYTCLG